MNYRFYNMFAFVVSLAIKYAQFCPFVLSKFQALFIRSYRRINFTSLRYFSFQASYNNIDSVLLYRLCCHEYEYNRQFLWT